MDKEKAICVKGVCWKKTPHEQAQMFLNSLKNSLGWKEMVAKC